MESSRPRTAEEAIPGGGSDPDYTGQFPFMDTEPDRPGQRRDIGEEIANLALRARVDGQDQEDGRFGERIQHRLGFGRGHQVIVDSL